jgi:REP element-mobilizing transposase RayT
VEVAGGIGHVYARGNNHGAIFADDDDRRRYLAILGSVVEARRWRCLGYCLMSNHVHLLVETPRANLGAGIGQAHGLYARSFNLRHGRKNHLFGSRYGVTPIRTEQHLWFAAAYVALNPVKARICCRLDDWPWSSHTAITGHRPAPWWLDVGRLLSFYEVLGPDARRRYADLVTAVQAMGAAGFEPADLSRVKRVRDDFEAPPEQGGLS